MKRTFAIGQAVTCNMGRGIVERIEHCDIENESVVFVRMTRPVHSEDRGWIVNFFADELTIA